MSYSLDQSLLALTASKPPKQARTRPSPERTTTPFDLPRDSSDRAAAARGRAPDRRSLPPPAENPRADETRRTDARQRIESRRGTERPEPERPARGAEHPVSERTKPAEPSRTAGDRSTSATKAEPDASDGPAGRAERLEDASDEAVAEGRPVPSESADMAPVPLDAASGEVAAEIGPPSEEDAVAAADALPLPEPDPEAPSLADAAGAPDAASGHAPGFALAMTVSAPAAPPLPGGDPAEAEGPEIEQLQPGQAQPTLAEEADPEAAPGDPAAMTSPGKREAFAEHLKTDPASGPGAGADGSKLAETLDADREQAATAPASVQAGAAQKPGQSAQAAAPATPQLPVAHQVPMGAIPIEIGLKAMAGVNRFEIRLDPAELGRIDVTLDIGEGGEVKAHLVVDRVETLALLQRDAKTLERAFEQAGLKPSEGGVDLSLRDPSGDGRFQQQQNQDERGRSGPRAARDEAPDAERAERPASQEKPMRWHGATGVDLRI